MAGTRTCTSLPASNRGRIAFGNIHEDAEEVSPDNHKQRLLGGMAHGDQVPGVHVPLGDEAVERCARMVVYWSIVSMASRSALVTSQRAAAESWSARTLAMAACLFLQDRLGGRDLGDGLSVERLRRPQGLLGSSTALRRDRLVGEQRPIPAPSSSFLAFVLRLVVIRGRLGLRDHRCGRGFRGLGDLDGGFRLLDVCQGLGLERLFLPQFVR